jgi:hypothetical protein
MSFIFSSSDAFGAGRNGPNVVSFRPVAGTRPVVVKFACFLRAKLNVRSKARAAPKDGPASVLEIRRWRDLSHLGAEPAIRAGAAAAVDVHTARTGTCAGVSIDA